MAALHGTFAFAQMDHVAVLIAKDLDLDVAGVFDQLLDVDAAIAEGAQSFARGGVEAGARSSARSTRRMPLPPPPATALSITGIAGGLRECAAARRPSGEARGLPRCRERRARPHRARCGGRRF